MRNKVKSKKKYRKLASKNNFFLYFSNKIPYLYKVIRSIFFYVRVKINPFISLRFLYLSDKRIFDLKKFRIKKINIDFVILGAQKSGTSSLHKYLDTHSQIFMSYPMKESRYFMGYNFAKKFYKRQFNIKIKNGDFILKNFILQGYYNERIIGESSTAYTIGQRSIEHSVPERMYNENPNLKFIYILRNPYARILSNYYHLVEKHSIKQDLNSLIQEDRNIVDTSLYFSQINKYINYFPKENFKLIIFEEFLEKKKETTDEILDFLNVPREDVNFNETFNKSKGDSEIKKRLLINDKTFKELSIQVEKDVEMLEEFIGRKIECWDLSASKWSSGI
ncbi:MAG: sulfotransferase [Bacteroidales bacterium]|nr:sulfotransferase [Bacteroidales bacterium]